MHHRLVLVPLLAFALTGCDLLGSETEPEDTEPPEVGQTKEVKAPSGLGALFSSMPEPGLTEDQCGDITEGGPVNGPDCVTAKIKCGETIIGHTKGGVNRFNTDFYVNSRCWPGTRNKNGGDERVYQWVFDDDEMMKGIDRTYIIASIDTPCADLDITGIRSTDAKKCPTSDRICDMPNPKYGARREYKWLADRGEVYYFIIEGPDDEEGPFAISLECNATRLPNK